MIKNKIFLSPPHMNQKERSMLLEAFDSGWIAPLGPHIDAFENEMASYLGVGHATALSSGSGALHLALRILGVNKGDKVVCPSLTFAASANAILYQHATPVFVDVYPSTWVIDVELLEDSFKKHHPKAFISVDLYGQSCNYDEIIGLCNKYNVALIEDAAEALGSTYQGKKLGNCGKIGILSFNGNKIMTTSGGGMLVSDNEDYVKKARFLATQAREPELHYEHKELGYNYRLSNLLAAVGRGQLKQIEYFVNKRRQIFSNYVNALSIIDGFNFMIELEGCRSNRWLTTLTIDSNKLGITRDEIIENLESENIESRPVWKPMHLQPLYNSCQYVRNDNRDVSAELFEKGLCLPSGSSLKEKDQNRIIDIILKLLNE
jgi:pyridoxal phosphate-dependent aminotransferase EpsN